MQSVRLASSAHLARKIEARVSGATFEQKLAGEYWYADARKYVTDLAQIGGLTTRQVAGIVAALSPQTTWERNLAGAVAVVAAKRGKRGMPRASLYDSNSRKAWKIASGRVQPEDVLGGPKVIPFYKNLTGDESEVTVDTWIWKGAGMGKTLTAARHRAIVRAYRVVARRMRLTPAQVQAIDWVVVRGRAN